MTAPVKAPPKPPHAPDVHLKAQAKQGKRKPPRTLKGDLKALAGKVSTVRDKWTSGRQEAEGKKETVRKEAKEVLAPARQKVKEEKKIAGQVVEPVIRTVALARKALDPGNSKTKPYVTSFMISLGLSWAVGPQILTATYERLRFGTSTTDWGVLHGPGRWFRDTVGMAVETGQVASLVVAICLGLAPMMLFSIRNATAENLARSSYRGRMANIGIRWAARLPYLVPLVYVTGVAYPEYVTAVFGSPWTLQWWQFWVAGLFCTAYYFTMWALDRIERFYQERQAMSEEERNKVKSMGPGLFHAVLMIPLASIVSGVLYTPGAAW